MTSLPRSQPVSRDEPCQNCNGTKRALYFSEQGFTHETRDCHVCRPQCDVHTSEVEFEYTNWEGRKSLRRARPISIRFGKSEWHPKPQWLMLAFDIDKGSDREFAMADMEFEDNALAALALSSAKPRCPNGLEHGNCGFPTCIPSCPGRLSLSSTHRGGE
jgi:hypothetical protein